MTTLTGRPSPLAAPPDPLLALQRRRPDVDLVLLEPPEPARASTERCEEAGAVLEAARCAVALVEGVVGRPVDQELTRWQGCGLDRQRLVRRAAHHDLAPGESVRLLRRLLLEMTDLAGWEVRPLATRRPTLLARCGETRLLVRAWCGALSLQVIGGVVSTAEQHREDPA